MSDPVADAAARLRAAGIDSPRLDARLLWEFAQRRPDIFERLVARRTAREPLAYIVGTREFWSLDFAVGPGCLIPRPETETLIEVLIRLVPDRATPLSILDLGTGSGCLLIAALKEYPAAHGVGIDSSPDALAWAARNVAAHDVEDRASLIQTGWIEEASPGFDIVLSNPPYIPSADIAQLEPEVRNHEPLTALDGGPDGLDAYRAIASRISGLLRPSGRALLELGIGQAEAVRGILIGRNLQVMGITPDLAGISRVIIALGNKKAA
ncbi:MAG: peptide chain release factor N(5)-glutamine methyltransferase [Rhizomicrobium sp.]